MVLCRAEPNFSGFEHDTRRYTSHPQNLTMRKPTVRATGLVYNTKEIAHSRY